MSSKSDWVAFSTADFLVGTTELSNDEVGVYIRLLCLQHQRGALPADVAQLNRLVPGAKRAWPAILSKFVPCGEGLVRNERMARECEAASSRMEFYKQRATAAAERRWSNPNGPKAPQKRSSKHASSTATSMPQALLEACSKQCLSDANESREEKNPPAPQGWRGGGDGDSPQEASQQTPTLALVRTLHRSADVALATLVRVRGQAEGRADFEGAVETRLRQAARRFAELGLPDDEAHDVAERTLAAWSWDEWSTTLANVVTKAKTMSSPADWLRWRLTDNQLPKAATA